MRRYSLLHLSRERLLARSRHLSLLVSAVLLLVSGSVVGFVMPVAPASALNLAAVPVVSLNPPVVVGTAPRTIAITDGPVYSTELSPATATVVGSNTHGTLEPTYNGETSCPTPAPTAVPTAAPTSGGVILYLHSVDVQPAALICIFGYNFTGSFPASGLKCGANQVQVQYYDYYTGNIRRDYGSLAALCPTITLNPKQAYVPGAATTLTVTPTDFDAYQNDQPKVLTFDGKVVGTFGYKKPISFVASAGCGTHQVTLVQASAYGTLSASADYSVRCPSVGVDPAVIARASQPVPVTVTAGGYPPNAAVTVAINGSPARGATTDGTGNLASPVTIANLPCANYTISVTTNALFAGVKVTGSAPFAVSCAALIAAEPGVVSAGMTTHITGWGFTPGSAVSLNWQLPDGSTIGVNGSPQVATGSAGTVDFYTLVLSTEPIGARTLTASDTHGLTAVAPLVVERGTMQPSNAGQQIQRLVTRR